MTDQTKTKNEFNAVRGFSLLEVSLALLFIGILLAAGLQLFKVVQEQEMLEEARHDAPNISDRIVNFYQREGRVPCPAAHLPSSHPDYGLETDCANGQQPTPPVAAGTCDTTTGDDESGYYCVYHAYDWEAKDHPGEGFRDGRSSRLRVGMIPFKVLGLEEHHVIDNHGNRLVYVADEKQAVISLDNGDQSVEGFVVTSTTQLEDLGPNEILRDPDNANLPYFLSDLAGLPDGADNRPKAYPRGIRILEINNAGQVINGDCREVDGNGDCEIGVDQFLGTFTSSFYFSPGENARGAFTEHNEPHGDFGACLQAGQTVTAPVFDSDFERGEDDPALDPNFSDLENCDGDHVFITRGFSELEAAPDQAFDDHVFYDPFQFVNVWDEVTGSEQNITTLRSGNMGIGTDEPEAAVHVAGGNLLVEARRQVNPVNGHVQVTGANLRAFGICSLPEEDGTSYCFSPSTLGGRIDNDPTDPLEPFQVGGTICPPGSVMWTMADGGAKCWAIVGEDAGNDSSCDITVGGTTFATSFSISDDVLEVSCIDAKDNW